VKAKPIIRREQANRDVGTAIASCLNDAGEAATLGFIEALENAYDLIGRHPASESPRYAHEFNLPGLRLWPLTRYPYLVFYIEHSEHIDIWRVLH